ncbi:MAG TPA: malto-oligosyltrehalose trehalohydrolase [Burkholderiales bacterium]|nr:malto-oligosyltrehalose trehalohydrolase [Burkholderiales bacterium]
MRLRHSMPFGAQLQEEGVRFRLWAPAAGRVDLYLEEETGHRLLPMAALPEPDAGWFALTTPQAVAGSRYRFRIDGGQLVPDPASRRQPRDVHDASEVIDPLAWEWQDGAWRGRPWHEVVLYELHVGAFTPAGTFAGVGERLDHLAALGVTAIELMPVADFPGTRNWGYDGVLPFAPDSCYGGADDLKRLVAAAHARGLMVFIDVVYNHFGPDGNYLHLYAPQFFTSRHHTPWGNAINFDGPHSRTVRDFFIHNALYWLEEYHCDGLRFDAVHAIVDESEPDILTELAAAMRDGPGRERHIHLVLENDANEARYLARGDDGGPRAYTAQWNDDVHHALHVIASGERGGYYADYAEQPLHRLGRCLTEGFAYQGEPSPFRQGARRGEPSAQLPPAAFVSFLQNHDQIGNRAFGERLNALAPQPVLDALTVILLLAPQPPLLFMGQEWGAPQPFLFFCDFGPDLAHKVAQGRRAEFARFPQFSDAAARSRIPDPNAVTTFAASQLDWADIARPSHRGRLEFHRQLLALRMREIAPRLCGMQGGHAHFRTVGEHGLLVQWRLGDGSDWCLVAHLDANLGGGIAAPAGRLLYAHPGDHAFAQVGECLMPWSVGWYLDEREGTRDGE